MKSSNKEGNVTLSRLEARVAYVCDFKEQRKIIVIIFICALKSDPLKEMHIVIQKWSNDVFICVELLQREMVGKIYIKE